MTNVNVKDLVADADTTEGVFDVLSKQVKDSLKEQFDQGFITGPDYAQVYLGALQSVISQSISFVLGVHTANAQASLLEQQTLTETQNTLKVTADVTTATNQGTLVANQANKVLSEIALIDNQNLTEVQKTALVTGQVAGQTAENSLISQRVLSETQNTNLISATKLKTDADAALTTAKATTEAQVVNRVLAEIAKIDQDTLVAAAEKLRVDAATSKTNAEATRVGSENTLIIAKQTTEANVASKVTAEQQLLVQKKETERGQVSDLQSDGLTAVDGILGAQRALYTAQKDGFARDAEQKVLKIMLDSWAVAKSTDNINAITIPTELDGPSINTVVTKAKTGIGVV